MTPDNTRELIAEAEEWAERALPPSPWGEKHVVRRLTVALAAFTSVLCAKCGEIPVLGKAEDLVVCMDCASEMGKGEAAALTTPQEEDARERLHAKCDCVPNLGPAHCHLCGNEKGEPVPWPECSAVRAAAPEPEWEWAVQVAGLNSSEPMYFEFPDPLAADHFIKNGALWYSPRPNGDPKTLVRRRKAGPWLPVGGDDE